MSYKDVDVADSLKRVVNFYNQYKRKPNTVTVAKQTVKWADYVQIKQISDKQAVVDKFKKDNGRDPAYVIITGLQINYGTWKALFEKTVVKTDSGDAVFNYFVKVFGEVKTIDEAFTKVNGRGYEYYYNDRDSNKTVIDRMKKKLGNNCTDLCQCFWHIAKALKYDVKCIHVQCQSGGHVRLQLRHAKHTGGNWINRDPACVLSNNGKPVTAIWCSNGRLIDVNPAWFMETINK